MNGLASQERCPTCLGRGTNSRGSLCPMCNGMGEVAKPAYLRADSDRERDIVRERPVRMKRQLALPSNRSASLDLSQRTTRRSAR